jgi:uncharacterized protein
MRSAALLLALAVAPALAGGEFELGMQAYERGDFVQAQRLFTTAARQGDAHAQELLGLMYAYGPELYRGVPRDLFAASQWLDRAAANGRPGARYLYCEIARNETLRAKIAAHCF